MTKLATNWDALLASTPISSQAAKDASARGTSFKPAKDLYGDHHQHSHAPFKTKPIKTGIDLTGHVWGRLTVIGLADLPDRKKSDKSRKAAWVVRCTCGTYEMRTARALRDPKYLSRAMCSECDYVSEMKAGRVKKRDIKLMPIGEPRSK